MLINFGKVKGFKIKFGDRSEVHIPFDVRTAQSGYEFSVYGANKTRLKEGLVLTRERTIFVSNLFHFRWLKV